MTHLRAFNWPDPILISLKSARELWSEYIGMTDIRGQGRDIKESSGRNIISYYGGTACTGLGVAMVTDYMGNLGLNLGEGGGGLIPQNAYKRTKLENIEFGNQREQENITKYNQLTERGHKLVQKPTETSKQPIRTRYLGFRSRDWLSANQGPVFPKNYLQKILLPLLYLDPTETSKQPIRTRYLGHVTSY
eukprot:sb/3471087/